MFSEDCYPLIQQNLKVQVPPSELCLFRSAPNGFPKRDTVAVSGTSEGSPFEPIVTEGASFASLFSEKTRSFFLKAAADASAHYVLLATKRGDPILVVSDLRRFCDLSLAVALPIPAGTVLAYLQRIPQISFHVDPFFDDTPVADFERQSFEHLARVFRALFSLTESPFDAPAFIPESSRFFSMLRKKISDASTLFGLSADFLIHQDTLAPMPLHAQTSLRLFSAVILLLLFAVRTYGIEPRVHVVFLSVGRCPALCLHFRSDSDRCQNSELLQIPLRLSNQFGGFFTSCHGDTAREEAERIHGVRHMMQNDRYAALGEHTICLFSPIHREWTDRTVRSPRFSLPDGFYRSFTPPTENG